MDGCLSLKGRADGILIAVNKNAAFEDITRALQRKIGTKDKFFNTNIIHFTFEGRRFSKLEKAVLLHEIRRLAGESTVVSFGRNKEAKRHEKRVPYCHDNGLYRGIVRSGQRVGSGGSLIIFGDVNPGGEIFAAGNIVVLGALRGTAHAGCTGNKNAVIAALDMRPVQLRIADIYCIAPDDSEVRHNMEYAYVDGKKIIVEQIKKQ